VLTDVATTREEAIAMIGHELHHAAEVVTDPTITEAADISNLYRRIGYVAMRTAGGQLYETREAVRAAAKILEELRRARRTPGHVWITYR
jgi:hypothetical protein